MTKFAVLLLVTSWVELLTGLPDVIPIGGLFHPSDDKQEIAFRYAVEKINSDRTILPRSKLQAQIEKIPPQDSFHASKKGNLVFYLNDCDSFQKTVSAKLLS
ncbi:hypothetical protein GWI33_010476 [Rhynchophorus ferrugineus]|uniref:Uncharacterized protein n=1 Tax=Rhynchophorus ferrugineus TaxID=354439 RepID=A0A834MJN7_RHYFE|nr:hypothetical protein GWI33_010476 [Rhynchophorus ferrugineus]